MQLTATDQQARDALVALILQMEARGELPATGGNFSFKTEAGEILVSRSGVDKSQFQASDFIRVDNEGSVHPDDAGPGIKPSDETLLHLAVYEKTNAGCVLHGHAMEALLFAEKNPAGQLQGLELIKALGYKTHDTTITVPSFPNAQDMLAVADKVRDSFEKPYTAPCFILKGHGSYIWGSNVAAAKRHLEALNYMFRYYCQFA